MAAIALTTAILAAAVGAPLPTRETQMGQTKPWDSSKWQYQQAVLIDNTEGPSELSDYQVKVTLSAPLFDFTAAADDGVDLRFTDSDETTLLDYWIESFSKADSTGVVWVKVPHIPARATQTIYLFWGNPQAPAAADGARTFEFFDDCEGDSVAAKWESALGTPSFSYVGYDEEFGRVGGVWHISGCTRRVSPRASTVYGGAHATYCAWTRPMAVYAPEVDKTFFAFGNEVNSPTVSYYDHRTGTLGPATVVGPNPNMDAHENPHMLIDEDAYIYLFHGSHCTPTLVKKSVRPYDTSAFRPMATITDSSSYPQPWQLRPGEITVLFRKGGTHDAAESYIKSTDGGVSWAKSVDFITTLPQNGCYGVSIAATGPYPRKVHMAWSLTRGDWWQRYHVFYAYSDDGGITWRKSDGSAYDLPITEATSEMIFESDVPDRGVWLKDIQLDSHGNPYILFIDGNTVTYDCIWYLARYAQGQWSFHQIARSDHMYDAGALVILADDDFRVYAPTTPSQPYEDGGEIEEWQSTDGGRTWVNTKHLTTGSTYSHNHVKAVYNHGRGDFRVFWNYGDAQNPPATREVDLYYYGEDQPGPQQMDLRRASVEGTGRFLKLSQPEPVTSLIKVKDLSLADVAICARAKTGPPETQHPMLCLGIDEQGHFYAAGLAHGTVSKIYRYTGTWEVVGEGVPKSPATWQDWSFEACGDKLRLVVDGEELVTVTAPGIAAGSVGARVLRSSFYLDDIRVRKCALPEPTAVLQAPSGQSDD